MNARAVWEVIYTDTIENKHCTVLILAPWNKTVANVTDEMLDSETSWEIISIKRVGFLHTELS